MLKCLHICIFKGLQILLAIDANVVFFTFRTQSFSTSPAIQLADDEDSSSGRKLLRVLIFINILILMIANDKCVITDLL